MTLSLSPAGRRYGFLPSLPDALTPRYRLMAPVDIPTKVDLSDCLGPVKDQGQLGACTAFAATGYFEYLHRKFRGDAPVFSPLFLYYKEREKDGSLGQGDTGSYGSTAVKVMQETGVCLESTDPYSPVDFERAPTDTQVEEAGKWKCGAYHGMSDIYVMKHCIASGYPVLIGFTVYESFENGVWGKDWTMPEASGGVLGGHEVYIKGYDDGRGAFDVRNSWGEGWGRKGDFWMPYGVIGGVLSEARMQHFGKAWG